MQLRYSTTSPFARKVRAAAYECGLAERIRLILSNPWAPGSPVAADNPLGKIPVLITDEGAYLYDSRVICEYLDALAGGVLFPAAGAVRWTALRRQALADGIADAAVLRRLESLRPDGERSDAWLARQQAAVARALDVLEGEVGDFGQAPTIGTIAIACALGYLDFRFAADDWRRARPALAAWYAGFAARPSMAATVLHDSPA